VVQPAHAQGVGGHVARKFIDLEDHQFLARFGVTVRENHRRFFTGITGDETTSESSWDSGAELVLDYMRAFNPQFHYTSRFSTYQPFNWSKNDSSTKLGRIRWTQRDSTATSRITPPLSTSTGRTRSAPR
jgi:hypothetical protein